MTHRTMSECFYHEATSHSYIRQRLIDKSRFYQGVTRFHEKKHNRLLMMIDLRLTTHQQGVHTTLPRTEFSIRNRIRHINMFIQTSWECKIRHRFRQILEIQSASTYQDVIELNHNFFFDRIKRLKLNIFMNDVSNFSFIFNDTLNKF